MKYSMFCGFFLFFFVVIGCKSDDDNEIQPIVTSFSGVVLYKPTMDPVTNGELFIVGRESRGITGGVVRVDTILRIVDGTFDVTFETIEKVDRFIFAVNILQDNFIINSFGWADSLQCLPGECEAFAPGKDYELTILVPCDPDDCVQFPLP